MAWRPASRSVYRALLLAYPAEFRQEYGDEMDRMVSERMATESPALLWLVLVADVFRNAPREHLHILVRDVRHSLRLFAQAPGFTATALAALALGIGAAVTIFTLIDTVLLRSLPLGEPDRLIYLWTPIPRYKDVPREIGPSFADILAWRAASHSFESITAFQQHDVTWNHGDESIRIGAAAVLGNFFSTLQAAPLLGRPIVPDDDRPGAERVAVLSYGLWNAQFGHDPAVLGRTMQLGGRPVRIIGVMAPDFVYPQSTDFPYANQSRTEVWIPLALSPQEEANRLISSMAAIGRLRRGVTLPHAQAEISALEKSLDTLNPPMLRGTESYLSPFIETAVGPVRPLMRLLAGAVLLVLLIACGNVANLLVARAVTREHEMGVRTALGAPRSRLVRQVLTESVLLSTAGGALGALLCFAAVRILARMNPGDIPHFEQLSVDWRVLVFALGISLATGIVFGAFPALAASRSNVVDRLREGAGRGGVGPGGSSMLRSVLVVADVALAVVLLGGAILLIRSYLYVEGEDKGFAPSTLTMTLAIDLQSRVPPQRVAAMSRDAVMRIESLAGVISAGATSALPLGHRESLSTFRVEGYPNLPDQTVSVRNVTGGYFAAMQIPLIAGRYLTSADIPAQPTPVPAAVVVSERFAKIYFHGPGRAIGGHVRAADPGSNGTVWSNVVGVVGDVRHSSPESAPMPTLYTPSWFIDSIAIRTALPPEGMVAAVRRALHELGSPFVLADIQTMRERASEAEARRRFQTVLLAAFAGIAVFLALVGLYGLLSYAVRQRTAEIGVRMALGAGRGDVIGMVLRQGLALAAGGLAIGLCGAATVARLGASLIYGVGALDPVTFAAVPFLVLAAASFACFLPAWKAARVDPATSLREQ